MKNIILILILTLSVTILNGQCTENYLNTTKYIKKSFLKAETKEGSTQVLFFINYDCSEKIKMVIIGGSSEIFTPFGNKEIGKTENGSKYFYQKYLDEMNNIVNVQYFSEVKMIRLWYHDNFLEFYEDF